MSHSPRSRGSVELVERWIYLQQRQQKQDQGGMERVNSTSVVHSTADPRRVKSALNKRDFQQPVETLTVSFSKLLVDQINGVECSVKKKKKRPASSKSVRNNKPVTQIDHVEEWLQQRSAHYAWWRKTPTTGQPVPRAARDPLHQSKTSLASTNRSQHHQAKPQQRCILWFQFTGNPQKRPGSSGPNSRTPINGRSHAIRIEQQPLGGANALVFAADLHIGEEFAILSRRQPGFTFSLTFYIDGVRHARLSGCCENARNLHVPTRVGGPIGAFVLRSVKGGEPCQVCEKSALVADPQLFTVWPKGYCRHLNISQDSGVEETHNETSRRRGSIKRLPKAGYIAEPVGPSPISEPCNEEPTAESVASEEVVDEQPSADTFVPCTESIEEIYDDLDSADERFAPQSISIEDVIHIISPNTHTPPSISMDSCD